MNIAILGFGIVGKGTCEILKNKKEKNINVTQVLRRCINDKNLLKKDAEYVKGISKTSSSKLWTADIKDIIKNKKIDAAVECIGDDDISFSYCKSLINAKKSIITSNKKMLAKYYKELITLAKQKKVSVLFEGSVCGGIPFINTLCNLSNISKINSIRGIMNGTSNYILYNMFEKNLSFDEALQEAQKLGYAENDPSDDIDGIDTKNKILIASNVAFKTSNDIKNVFAFGIRNIKTIDIEFCKKHNMVCKLVAEANIIQNSKSSYITIGVFPEFIHISNPYAKIDSNNNIVSIDSFGLAVINLSGAGAGSLPTGHAVVSDLVLLNEQKAYKAEIANNIKINNNKNISGIYFRADKNIDKEELITLLEEITNKQISYSNFTVENEELSKLEFNDKNLEVTIYPTKNANTYLIYGLNILQISKIHKKFNNSFIAKINV